MTNPTSAVNPSPESLAALGRLDDDDPIVMVNLLKFRGPGGAARYAKYGAVAGREIAARGGRVIYSGRRVEALPQPGIDWDSIALVFYPSRAAYLDMQKSEAYIGAIPDRTAGLERRLLYAFKRGLTLAGANPPEIADVALTDGDEVFVANLLSFRGDAGRAEYLKYGQVATRLISDLGGEVVLFLEAEHPLVSDNEWENFVLVRYPSVESLQEMVAGDEWQKAHKNHREPGLAGTIALPTHAGSPSRS